jgi:cation diffusion facilitator CzcD-associated flavoprotein CzcO
MTNETRRVDVLIVGAGLTGVGLARHLQTECPQDSFALLESRSAIGGTWDLFRYPGIRSDSDMYTFSYGSKPWLAKQSLGDGTRIRNYINEAATEAGVDKHIHFQHKVVSADWSSEEACWTVKAVRTDTGESVYFACNFLMMCCGYYDYENGYAPEFRNQDKFGGQTIHAQHWPEGLEFAGKRVVVIGSGATAVTLVPELAKETEHTVMLQRSPSYIHSQPIEDPLAVALRKFLPATWAFRITRWKQMAAQMFGYQIARRRPEFVRSVLLRHAREALGSEYDIDKHFTPRYNPWDQRVCAVPENDLFNAIREQWAEVVTDHIDTFTETGIQLESGRALKADIIVLATGLNMKYLGGASVSVDGQAIDLSSHFVYRGTMLSNLPNLGQVFGYTNSSWTLKADLISKYVCRLRNHMRRSGSRVAIPRVDENAMQASPFLDLSSGYVTRGIDSFPRQGNSSLWRIYQNYYLDFFNLRVRPIRDHVIEFQ